jgi:hypothetical protein
MKMNINSASKCNEYTNPPNFNEYGKTFQNPKESFISSGADILGINL